MATPKPGRLDLTAYEGADHRVKLQLADSDGNVIDVSSRTFAAAHSTSAITVEVIDATQGRIDLVINRDDTLPPLGAASRWDFWQSDPPLRRPLLSGTFTVKEGVAH